jgi:5-formyltetrahydrofolate cyclo-ligase
MRINTNGKNIGNSKKVLRKLIQERRDNLSNDLRQEKSTIIIQKLLELKQYSDSINILAYFPFRSEINTRMLIEKALFQGKRIALPKVNKKKLDLYYIKSLLTGLEPGCYDIMEPVPSECERALPLEIDLVIVPGVGFDAGMNRLGYGGGFYDKLLREISPQVPRIALAFDLQVVDHVPVSEHDLKIDILITESRIYGS